MTLLRTPSYESSLSQAERLALCSGRFSPAVLGCDEELIIRTVAPARFPSPRMARVRENDGRLALHGSPCNVSDADDEETSEDDELAAFALYKRRDAMRDASLLMPSQRGYSAAWSEARDYGYASE